MKIAIQCYGGIRCAFRDQHIEHFIQNFPEIFNEDNEVDVFLLTTYEDKKAVLQHTKESIEKELTRLFGHRLKKLVFFEDYSDEIKAKEDQIYDDFMAMPDKHMLNHDEMFEYQNTLVRARDQYELIEKSFPYGLGEAYHRIKLLKYVEFQKDHFVPRYYYRRYLVNEIRKQWQQEHDQEYDWVVCARIFDFEYIKEKPMEFLYSPPPEETIFYSIDNMIITSPTIMDKIFEPFAEKFVQVGYEQYFHPQFEKNRCDHYHFYIRSTMTYSSENQLEWQCITNCKNMIRINLGGNQRKVLFPEGYFFYHFCEKRKE